MAALVDSPHKPLPGSKAEVLQTEFVLQVHLQARNGYNGAWEQKKYVSSDVPASFWTAKKLQDFCDGLPNPLIINIELVRTQFIRAFSALVYAGWPGMIKYFVQHGLSDEVLPLADPPPDFPTASPFSDCFKDFVASQWIFFPLIIPFRYPHDRLLPMQRIIPILKREVIQGGPETWVYKIELDHRCNGLREGPVSSSNTYVLKVYKKDSLAEYDAEVDTFTVFTNFSKNNAPPPFLKSYGQYRQGDSLHLVLDYMGGGSLDTYMRSHQPPQTETDMIDFWNSIRHAFASLVHIHAVKGSDNPNGGAGYVIIHRDVKPGNIMLSDINPLQPYVFTSVIVDFGYSSVQQVRDGQRAIHASATGGDKRYSAPEVCQWEAQFDKIPTQASASSDVFSLCAVVHELAVWASFGYSGVIEYQRKRKEEHKRIDGFSHSGYDGSFHDGKRVLLAVASTHEELLDRPQYRVTERVLRMAEHQMMCSDPDQRASARELYDRLGQIIRGSRQSLKPPPVPHVTPIKEGIPHPFEPMPNTSSPEPMSPGEGEDLKANGRSPPLLSTPTSRSGRHRRNSSVRESLTLDEALRHLGHKKNPRETRGDAEVQRVITQIQTNLVNRDHLFFIDDTRSMSLRSEDVVEAFKALAYIAKDMDSDGIELAFASCASRTPRKNHKTKPLVTALEQHAYVQESSRMEDSLSQLIQSQVRPRLEGLLSKLRRQLKGSVKPLSIYVLTDGAWGEGNEGALGADRPIEDLIKFLDDHRFSRTQVVFQFIQFGNDPNGSRYLKYLDNFREGKWDIVDTRHITGNVYAMFFGAICKQIDEADDEQQSKSDPTSPSPSGVDRVPRWMPGESDQADVPSPSSLGDGMNGLHIRSDYSMS